MQLGPSSTSLSTHAISRRHISTCREKKEDFLICFNFYYVDVGERFITTCRQRMAADDSLNLHGRLSLTPQYTSPLEICGGSAFSFLHISLILSRSSVVAVMSTFTNSMSFFASRIISIFCCCFLIWKY